MKTPTSTTSFPVSDPMHGSRSSDVKPMGAVTISRNGYIEELEEENRRLKDMMASLSKTHATDTQRLSDMIDKRQEALRYISEIIEEKAAEREDLELGSTAYKSVRRWASEFLHNEIAQTRAQKKSQ